MFQHVYLSPHYDDASLSCGGAIHRQVKAGEPVLVVTICAAPPPTEDPLSPFAMQLHSNWGNPEDVVATRRIEDQTSMEILGADYLRLHLSDCIYRGQSLHKRWYYNSGSELFGDIHPDDLALTAEIIDTVNTMVPHEDDTILYAPLTVGHHVDHQLVHAAAMELRKLAWNVQFYEDYPYVDPVYSRQDDAYNLEGTLKRLQQAKLQPQTRSLSEENLRAKIDSIAAYASQLDVLFSGQDKMETQVRDYTLQVGSHQWAERLWIPG